MASNIKRGMNVKVYVVCQFLNLVPAGKPNLRILGTKLTHEAAQRVVDENPGTFIEKLVADKL